MSHRSSSDRRAIAARVVGGVGGSYAVATAIDVALARMLPLAPAEAMVTATLVGALAMPTAAIWAFGARTAKRAWGGLLLVGGGAAIVALLAGPRP